MTFSHVLTFAKCGTILILCCCNAATDTVQNIQRNTGYAPQTSVFCKTASALSLLHVLYKGDL